MKNKINSWLCKFGGTFAAMALMIATVTAGSACCFTACQPEEPEELR